MISITWHVIVGVESEAAAAMLPPPVASVPSDDWLSSIDDPVLRERIRYISVHTICTLHVHI